MKFDTVMSSPDLAGDVRPRQVTVKITPKNRTIGRDEFGRLGWVPSGYENPEQRRKGSIVASFLLGATLIHPAMRANALKYGQKVFEEGAKFLGHFTKAKP
jgi:hypothetical protein